MKVCKYCGSENENKAKLCSSCGANEFKHKCGNCGTIYEDGEYCPKCGVKTNQKPKKCPKCGMEYYSNACPNCGYTSNNQDNTTTVYVTKETTTKKKRKTWLWVLGWIYIFPVPLTILMLRNQKLKKGVKIGIIAVAWILYLIIALSGNSDSTSSTTDVGNRSNESTEITATDSNIKKLSFLSDDDITLKVGQKKSSSYLNVTVKSKDSFTPNDVVFVSDDPNVATIAFSHDALTTYLYYEIVAVGGGETYVYATSKDGSIVSEKIKVTVPQPIAITSITVTPSKTEFYIGETAKASASVRVRRK